MRRRSSTVMVVAGALVAGAALAGGATSAATAVGAGDEPALTLETGSESRTVQSYGGKVYDDLGVYAVAGRQAFEVRARRTSYDKRLVATLTRAGQDVALPAGAASEDFSGLGGFYRLVVKNSKGTAVIDQLRSFCPNSYDQMRRRPDAPATSPYPYSCYGNAYSTGAVFGLQQGFATPLVGGGNGDQMGLRLKPGTYVVDIDVTTRFRRLLGMSAAQGHAQLDLTVVAADQSGARPTGGRRTTAASEQPSRSRLGSLRRMNASSASAASTPMPDLRSLPAWGIQVDRGRYLAFSATVWNAGPSQLLVDGFRRSDNPNLMDAYQYFLDADGHQVGYQPAGTMAWDDRDGHSHWHFTDFASYRLLDKDKSLVVRSQKESFCLANTDAVDYLVPNANWRPDNTDLRTACGDRGAVAMREVLEPGSGDTYAQWRPGQSFPLAGLPNGTYYIEVLANPENTLAEGTTSNNASYRKVIIGGRPNHRTVTVPKVGIITEPATGGQPGQ